MPGMKRETIDFDPALYDALQERAIEADASISDVLNDMLRSALDEDAEDHAMFERRRNEPNVPFENVLGDMKRRGRI